MRNTVQILDPANKKITIEDIEVGQLFRYLSSNSEGIVYMKVSPSTNVNLSNNAVHLGTGIIYFISLSANIETISAVQIG